MSSMNLAEKVAHINFLKKYLLNANAYQSMNILLEIAAKNDDVELFRVLIERGADIDWAVCVNVGEEVKKFIQDHLNAKAPVVTKNNVLNTLLRMEVDKLERMRKNMFEFDTKAPVSPPVVRSAVTNEEFFRAVINNKVEQVDQMIKDGFDINEKCKSHCKYGGHNALIISIYKQNWKMVDMLLSHRPNIHLKDNHGDDALIAASSVGNLDLVKKLVFEGANIEATCNRGKTALDWAKILNYKSVAEYLKQVEKSCNRRAGNKPTNKEFFDAIRSRKVADVERMLDNGFDINEKEDAHHHSTALIKSIFREDWDMAEMLLERGADVNARNDLEDTALIAAATKGDLTLMERLVAKGADIEAINREGDTALKLARKRYVPHSIRFLRRNGAQH